MERKGYRVLRLDRRAERVKESARTWLAATAWRTWDQLEVKEEPESLLPVPDGTARAHPARTR
eukprot:7319316-Pyramimonas_sp.AAC.1